jgi:hypothetical protein
MHKLQKEKKEEKEKSNESYTSIGDLANRRPIGSPYNKTKNKSNPFLSFSFAAIILSYIINEKNHREKFLKVVQYCLGIACIYFEYEYVKCISQ